MAQYIDKSALVEEIERRIKSINSCPFRTAELGSEKLDEGQLNAYNVILSFINTLEVKEVDNTIIENLNELAVNEIKSLYTDIDECIMDLITARSKHDSESIENIYWRGSFND